MHNHGKLYVWVMSLVLGTIVWVLSATVVVGVAVYAVDRITEREERKQ